MDLVPCPFCNCLHAPSVHTDERGFFVWCDTNYGGCGSRGAVASTNKGALIVWNHRAPATTANDGVVTVLSHTGPLPSPSPDIIPPLANAPADPALLALAKLGAMVLDWSPLECGFPTMPGSVIDAMAVKSGCALEDSGDGGHACWTAPNVRLAIAALLAPDGAQAQGATDGD